MATITDIKLKRSATAGKIPLTTDLDLGEIAINTHDGKLYIKKDVSGTESIVLVGPASASNTVYSRYIYTATASQTTFAGLDDNSNTLAYDIGYADVYVNGVKLIAGTDFTATSGSSIVMATGLAASDIVEIIVMGSGNMSNLIVTRGMNKFVYTATASQTTFSGTDDNAATLAYAVDQIQVYFNGALLDASDYTASSGTSVVLGTAAAAGDIVTIIALYTDDIDYIGDLDITGNLTVSGDATIAGNLTFGNASTDTVTFSADVTSNILPDVDSTYTLGSNTQRWSDIYTDNVYVTNNVGIGTTSPTSYANSQATLVIEDSTSPSIAWSDTGQTRDWFAVAQGSGLSFKYADGGGSGTATNVTNVLALDNSGNVGIGTSSPEQLLHVLSASSALIRVTASTASVAGIDFGDITDTDIGRIRYNNADNSMAFTINASEAMRIDSSGSLLVGKTSSANGTTTVGHLFTADGVAVHTRSGNTPLRVARTTDDGELIGFTKDGTTVGSISTYIGDLTIGTGDVGLWFQDGGNAIRPFRVDSNVGFDDNISLGVASERFKDLYLSGGLRADTLTFSNLAGTERMRIDSSGNVGIGVSVLETTSSTRTALTIDNSFFAWGRDSYNEAGVAQGSYRNSAGNDEYRTTGVAVSQVAFSAGTINLQVAASGTNGNTISWTDGLVVDNSGNVGIGTSSPSASHKLDVIGDVRIANSSPRLEMVDTDISGIWYIDGGSNALIFQNNASERLRIDANGLVGIGVNSPSSYYANELVVNAGGEGGLTLVGSTTHENYLAFADGTTGTDRYSGYLSYNHGSNFMRFATNGGAERMRIDSSGNVGIGTTSPSFLISTSQDVSTTGSDFAGLNDNTLANFQNINTTIGTGSYIRFQTSTGSGNVWWAGLKSEGSSYNSDFIFSQRTATSAATERMRIDSSGNLLVGKTAVSLGTTGNEIKPDGEIRVTTDGGFGLQLNRLTSDGEIINFRKDGTTVGSIGSNGGKYLTIGNNTSGLGFIDAGSPHSIRPWNVTTNLGSDDNLDLGASANRFKNLYLSEGLRADTLTFSNLAGTERMRIDSSGNFYVGTTVLDPVSGNVIGTTIKAQGNIQSSRDGGVVISGNRKTSDGAIFEARKDGTNVGNIGSVGGDLFIGTGTTGVRFVDANSSLYPINTTNLATRDGEVDLGKSAARFKDLYLSGGVYVGGTGAANLLDDYEEGTWTPTLAGSTTAGSFTYSNQEGYYVKVGNKVTITFSVTLSAIGTAGTGFLRILGSPWTTSGSAAAAYARGSITLANVNFDGAANTLALLPRSSTSSEFTITEVLDGANTSDVSAADLTTTSVITGQITLLLIS